MSQELVLSYKCGSCRKEYGPLTTKRLGEFIEVPVNCMACKTMYTTKAEMPEADIVLIDKTCKKCKGELVLFTGECPSCRAIAVSIKK